MFSLIRESEFEIIHDFNCSICYNHPIEPITTFCGHVFCWTCYYCTINYAENTKCPLCRNKMNFLEVVSIKISDKEERSVSKQVDNLFIPPRPVFQNALCDRNDDLEIYYKSFGKLPRRKDIEFFVKITKRKLSYYIFFFFSFLTIVYKAWQNGLL
ncbi:hypothetical protein GVAV_001296 [Gurleya vavrai]